MRVTHIPTREEVRSARRARYLLEWPIERQMEAHAEAAAGRPEKLDAMLKGFAEIRGALPFSN